jgi:hypothetical protein
MGEAARRELGYSQSRYGAGAKVSAVRSPGDNGRFGGSRRCALVFLRGGERRARVVGWDEARPERLGCVRTMGWSVGGRGERARCPGACKTYVGLK